jgi:hypothetical protein
VSRSRELAARRLALQVRSARQRQELGAQLAGVRARVRQTDERLHSLASLVLRPAALAGAILFVLVAGRTRSLTLIGTGLAVMASGLRLQRLLNRFLGDRGSALRR